MSYPPSGPPWHPGQPEQNQPQYGGYPGGPAYPDQSQSQYGGQGYPQESYTTEPPYSGQPYSGQPYSGQPYSGQSYQGQPYDQGYGTPQQPGYDQGYRQQPGYQQAYPPGYGMPGVAPAPPGRGRGGMIALIGGAAFLLLLVCGVGGVLVLRSGDDEPTADPSRPASPAASATATPGPTATPSPTATGNGEYPARIVLPTTSLAGMTRLTNAELQKSADKTAADLKTNTGADSAVAGYYAPSGDVTKTVGLIGATTRITNPGRELDEALDQASVSGISTVEEGPLGGVMKCGNSSSNGNALTVCGWADGGSLALGIFLNRSLADSATLFVRIRSEILIRG